MDSMISLTILVVVLMWFGISVVRAFARIWIQHQRRVAALEGGGAEPDVDAEAAPEDFRLTSVLLAALGAAAVGTGFYLGHGDLAVGLYVGGFLSAGLGVLIGLLGVVLHALAKPATETPPETSP